MSTIRYFDVPHIFRYGRTDEEKGETWHLFYRNATCFTVDIKRVDIANTPFEREWSEYCVEGRRPDWIVRWDAFCDLVIRQILPILQDLAPVDGRQWFTLEDYLQTPQYKLQMFKDDTSGDAAAKVVDGPRIVPAFEMRPQAMTALQMPPGFPRIAAEGVIVLDHQKDLRQRPHKIRVASTGEVYALICAERPTRAAETGVMTNPSLEAMARMFETLAASSAEKSGGDGGGATKPVAIVTTFTRHPVDLEDGSIESGELMIAGLIHTLAPEQIKVTH